MRYGRHLLAVLLSLSGCASTDELAGPAIPLMRERGPGEERFSRTHGVLEMYLTPADPSRTIWNDPATKADAWGTITLVGVDADGAVTITLGDETLRARVGERFPGTGIHVIASGPAFGSALLRSRVTVTIVPSETSQQDAERLRDMRGMIEQLEAGESVGFIVRYAWEYGQMCRADIETEERLGRLAGALHPQLLGDLRDAMGREPDERQVNHNETVLTYWFNRGSLSSERILILRYHPDYMGWEVMVSPYHGVAD